MPWTQRAFVFHMMHPSSQLRVGVFDYDPPMGRAGITEASHEKIGKVNIDITNCFPGTVYTMRYDLYTLDNEARVANGSITVRLRIELRSQRNALLAALNPKTPYFVSVTKKNDFKSTKYTIAGKGRSQRLLLQKILASGDELLSYTNALYYVEMAAFTIIFWRGHYPFTLSVPSFSNHSPETAGCWERCTRPLTILLPLHSMTAFVWGIFVVQDMNRLPAFLAFAVGWALLATMEHVRRHPSPWHRCRSYNDLLCVLLFNRSMSSESIDANENVEAIEAFQEQEKALQQLLDKEKDAREQAEAEMRKAEGAIEAGEEEVDITSKASGLMEPFNPFKPLLRPVAAGLKRLCVSLRIAKSVVLWRDSCTAFFIVTASFVAALVLVWIPWSFLIVWLCRIVVWLVLGPWMKLVDIFYVQRRSKGYATAEEMTDAFESGMKNRYQAVVERGRALKLQAMAKYMFGKYIMRVPVLKEDLFWDDPLPSSTAKPADMCQNTIKVTKRKWGQTLTGDMIPARAWMMIGEEDKLDENSSQAATETDPLLVLGGGKYGACTT